jgi:OOP family OmpA-OmpF porin
MQHFFKVLSLALIFSSVLFVTVVSAQDVGPYFAASIGQSDIDLPVDKGTSFSLGFGYSLNKNFAVEASYIDFGEASDDIAPIWTLSADGFVVNFVGKVPFNEKISGFANLGFLAWDIKLDEAGTGTIATDEGTDFTYGLGIMFGVTDKVSCNLQYQMYEFDDVDVDNISVGIQVGF